ncbi:MAG: transcription antitermination factor NusB [Actinobacteria bacterium]|nr:transcription antitermination factor NusB [Actinomycetota bacterium]
MSARSKSRKGALDLLYEADIRNQSALAIHDERKSEADVLIRDYTSLLLRGVTDNRRKIDELISTYAEGWDMDRMPAVDRNILRIGIFELLWCHDIPDSVAINESLELAKTLSTDESAGYVNGILGRISSIKEDIVIS